MSTKLKNELAQIRDKIAAAKTQLECLDEKGRPRGRIPRQLAEQEIDCLIAGCAEKGRLPVINLADGHPLPYLDGRSFFNLLCWLDPDMVRARFCEELDGVYADGDAGIAPAERANQVKDAERTLFELEVAEERLIMQAEETGMTISRRGDADPRAVLEA